jgi:polyisoprenoid-binding protein YceI
MRLSYLLTASLLFVTSALAQKTLVLDPAKTTIDFTLGDVLHTVHGSFKLKSGVIHFDPATGKANGSIVVDATSGDSGSKARDKRMHKNILESDRYPEIVFTPDNVTGKISAEHPVQVQVHGVFRMHGADHEMTLPFEVKEDGDNITAATQFPIPYVRWGMRNPSTFILKVNETVDIAIHAIGRLSADAQ